VVGRENEEGKLVERKGGGGGMGKKRQSQVQRANGLKVDVSKQLLSGEGGEGGAGCGAPKKLFVAKKGKEEKEKVTGTVSVALHTGCHNNKTHGKRKIVNQREYKGQEKGRKKTSGGEGKTSKRVKQEVLKGTKGEKHYFWGRRRGRGDQGIVENSMPRETLVAQKRGQGEKNTRRATARTRNWVVEG